MPELNLVMNDPKTGKSYSKKLEADLSGRKIGEKISGNELGLGDFEFQITGGSDTAGFPMRKDIPSVVRKSALLSSGPGVKIKRKGLRVRKTVRGDTVGNITAQVNLKIIKSGKDSIERVLGIEPKKEEQPPEKMVSEEKREAPKEESKLEHKEE